MKIIENGYNLTIQNPSEGWNNDSIREILDNRFNGAFHDEKFEGKTYFINTFDQETLYRCEHSSERKIDLVKMTGNDLTDFYAKLEARIERLDEFDNHDIADPAMELSETEVESMM